MAQTEAGKYMVFPALQPIPVITLPLAFQSSTLLFLRQKPRRPGYAGSSHVQVTVYVSAEWTYIHLPYNHLIQTAQEQQQKDRQTRWDSWRRTVRKEVGKKKKAEMKCIEQICQQP